MRNTIPNANCDVYTDAYGHVYSNAYSYGNGDVYSNAYSYSDGNADANGNARAAEANTDATAATFKPGVTRTLEIRILRVLNVLTLDWR